MSTRPVPRCDVRLHTASGHSIRGLLGSQPRVLVGWDVAERMSRLLDLATLRERFADRRVRLEFGRFLDDDFRVVRTTFEGALYRVATAENARPAHLAQCDLERDLPGAADQLCVRGLFPSRWVSTPLLWVSSCGTTTPSHFDHAHNLNVQIQGRKRIHLAPPDSPLQRLARRDARHFSALDLAPAEKLAASLNGSKIDVWETVLEPGEALSIPVGWWHRFQSIEPTVNVSVFWRKSRDVFRCLARGQVRVGGPSRPSQLRVRLLGREIVIG